jgi:hypothetical protein
VAGAAVGAVVLSDDDGATVLDVAGAAVLRGFGFTFVAAVPVAGADVAVKAGDATVDARADALATGEVLPVGVAFPQPVAIPMMASTAKPVTAMPILCSFFISGPSDSPPLSA